MFYNTEDFIFTSGAAKVHLRAYIQYDDTGNPEYIRGGRLRVDVIAAENFPTELFVWELYRTTFAQKDPTLTSRPVCIAKPGDLALPAGQIAEMPENGALPYFRETYLDMDIASPDILLDTWAKVKLDVAALVRTVMALGGPPA